MGVFVILGNEIAVDEIGFDITRGQATCGPLCVSPLCGSNGAAAFLTAAARGANHKLSGFRRGRVVAAMNSFAEAAGVGRGCGGCRQSQRGEISRDREKQQQSGGQAMHADPKDYRSLPTYDA
jgi:hypothetical protein